MAKSLSGQLSEQFKIPAYAQDMLYVVTETSVAQTSGKFGAYTLESAPDGDSGEVVRLVWGTPEGPTLAFWDSTKLPTLQWDGRITVGGFIERLHAREIGGLEVVIVEVVGGPFPRDHVSLPSVDDMRRGVFARPSDTEPSGENQSYPFIILAESNLAGLAHDALVSGIAVDAFGSLASEAGRWHEVVGLPLLLDSLTLLAP
jgi:hypothetical protein